LGDHTCRKSQGACMTVPLVRTYADSAVLIGGGTSGVGLATALAFADAGVRRIALLGRDADRGAAARQQVEDHCPDAQVEFLACDAGELSQVIEAVGTVRDRLGGLDVLVSSTTT